LARRGAGVLVLAERLEEGGKRRWRSGTRCDGCARRSGGPTPSSGRPSAPPTLCKLHPSFLLLFFSSPGFSRILSFSCSSICEEIPSHLFSERSYATFRSPGLGFGVLLPLPFQLDLPARQAKRAWGTFGWAYSSTSFPLWELFTSNEQRTCMHFWRRCKFTGTCTH